MTADPRRDIFFVSNSVDELGGVTSWSHQMARLFTERGHRVKVIGITDPEAPRNSANSRTPPSRCTTSTRRGSARPAASGDGSTWLGAGCVPNGRRGCASRPPS